MRPFTQSAYVLTKAALTVDELQSALAAFEIIEAVEPAAHWAGGSEGWVVRGARPEMRLTVDIVNAGFVDDLVSTEDAMLQAVWQAGGLGPSVGTGSLTRAGKQAWVWPVASAAVRSHDSFVRFRISWVGGSEADRSPIEELTFMTLAVAAVLAVPEKPTAYFNPNGESLRSTEFVHAALAHHGETGEVPLDVWCNIGLERINTDETDTDDDAEKRVRMLTAGMSQLSLPDVVAEFTQGQYTFEAVDGFLRDISAYLVVAGDVIEGGHVVDGPEGDWTARREATQLVFTPTRPAVDD